VSPNTVQLCFALGSRRLKKAGNANLYEDITNPRHALSPRCDYIDSRLCFGVHCMMWSQEKRLNPPLFGHTPACTTLACYICDTLLRWHHLIGPVWYNWQHTCPRSPQWLDTVDRLSKVICYCDSFRIIMYCLIWQLVGCARLHSVWRRAFLLLGYNSYDSWWTQKPQTSLSILEKNTVTGCVPIWCLS